MRRLPEEGETTCRALAEGWSIHGGAGAGGSQSWWLMSWQR